MKSATGRWVSGDDFFNRKAELEILERRVRDGNHILLTGQRRMGKTSVAQELGRRLETQEWVFLFADVEGASSPEDLIAAIAKATHPIRAISSRVAGAMSRFIKEHIDEINAHEFGLKFRAGWGAELGADMARSSSSCAPPTTDLFSSLSMSCQFSSTTCGKIKAQSRPLNSCAGCAASARPWKEAPRCC